MLKIQHATREQGGAMSRRSLSPLSVSHWLEGTSEFWRLPIFREHADSSYLIPTRADVPQDGMQQLLSTLKCL